MPTKIARYKTMAIAITYGVLGTIVPFSLSAEPIRVLHCENPARVIRAEIRPEGGPSSVTDNEVEAKLDCRRIHGNPQSLFEQVECDGKWPGTRAGGAHLEIDAGIRSGAPVPGLLASANFGQVALICQEK